MPSILFLFISQAINTEKLYMLWFILDEHEISGPFSQEYILDTCNEQSLVWGPGLNEWSPKEHWVQLLNAAPEKHSKEENSTIVKPATESEPLEIVIAEPLELEEEQLKKQPIVQVTVSTQLQKEKIKLAIKWYYACSKEKFGPFMESELIQMLKMLNFSSPVYIWNKDLENWAKLEDFPELMAQVTDFAA